MKVNWTKTAVSHLQRIHDYIAADSAIYARRMIGRLRRRTRQIVGFPLMGGKVIEYDADDVREVLEGPYRIIYRALSNRVDILAVVHGAQLLPPEL
jgi:plasmid stabilization system protein ParE